MRELLYTILELEEWNKRATCDFCSSLDRAVCEIRTRSKATDKIVASGCACENCKEKFENDELPKCDKCGRLQIESSVDIRSGKYLCRCVKYNESQEKELPVLPHERREAGFYERQINSLREKLTTAEVALEMEREEVEKFQEKSEEWGKRQKQELLDKIKQQEIEITKLTQEIKKLNELNPQELVNELNSYKKEIERLKAQLEQLTSQPVAQIEVKEVKKQLSWLRLRK